MGRTGGYVVLASARLNLHHESGPDGQNWWLCCSSLASARLNLHHESGPDGQNWLL